MLEPNSSPLPYEILAGNDAAGLLVVADHATNVVPEPYGDLGLPPGELERHIGYDIGVEWVVRTLNRVAGLPAVMARFSRLVIDANRGEDDPTLVMRLSDGAIVPGNADVDEAERLRRIERFHRPYHAAIAGQIDRMAAAGPLPAVISIHSFTPVWRGRARPWHIGILWDLDRRLPLPLMDMLRRQGWEVGDNEPYDGALRNDTLYRHCTRRGLANVLVEFRQDLVANRTDATIWAERLWNALVALKDLPDVHEVRHFGSRTGPVL